MYAAVLYCTGSAADLCKAAMIQVEKALAERTDLQARFDDTFKRCFTMIAATCSFTTANARLIVVVNNVGSVSGETTLVAKILCGAVYLQSK